MLSRKQKNWISRLSKILFFIYLIVLAYFLFFCEGYGRSNVNKDYQYNLVLFKEIKRFFKYRHLLGWRSFMLNIVGNVIAFAPFGFALPVISPPNRNFFNVVFYSFEFSLIIELIQLIYKVGTFDVDDIFLNTMGGMLGYICFAIGMKMIQPKRKKEVGQSRGKEV